MTMHLQRDLEKIRKEVLHLGALVRDITHLSVEYLGSSDSALVEKIAKTEEGINELEVSIDEECLKILALHQPVAIDLRFIVVVMKVTNDLERMGDQAVNITHRVQALSSQVDLRDALPVVKMAEAVENMVDQSLDALVKQDAHLAQQVVDKDDIVDDLHAQNYQILRDTVVNNPQTVNDAMSYATISSNLERIGDLCTNIAEEVIFMVEGTIVRHQE